MTLLGGALMGAAIAMLVTPKTGRQMRDHIRDFIGDELDKIRSCLGSVTSTSAIWWAI